MRAHLQVVLMTTAFLLAPIPAFAAEEVTVFEIIDMAAQFAGEELTVEGELVGDYGFRNDGWMWTQLNGDAYVAAPLREGGPPVGANIGIGVRIPVELAEGLDPPGGYRNRGPVVRVTGIWKYHDPERQGESYLEVEALTVTEAGRQLDEGANWTALISGSLLLAAAGIVARLTSPDD